MTPTTIALAVAALLSGSLGGYAQTMQSTSHHRHVHHVQEHHYTPHPAPEPAIATPAPQAAPFGLAWPHIAPYPNGKGDEDGLSDDPNDCNMGCIGGNTPD